MKKVFIVGGGQGGYSVMFKELGYHEITDITKANLVCFTGGADVSPNIYGDSEHRTTSTNPFRDAEEAKLFQYCVGAGKNMVGICRGGQFLNVMSGGRMYQHVSGHTRSHWMTDARTGQDVYVSSTHHQMMMPSSDAILVATSHEGSYREWFDGDVPMKDVSSSDIEVVMYPEHRALCFQPHPEFAGKHYEGMREYFNNLLKEFFK